MMALGNSPTRTTRLVVSGRVQRVGFRDWVRRTARRLELDGWVRNLADGRVEMLVAGRRVDVDEMIARCRNGPQSATVAGVDVVECAAGEGPARGSGFKILPTA
ncbi:MAG: acylphosphatase [Hyphomicrobiaceae bacterium]